MVNPGPERELIPTIKKKGSTLSNLIAKKNYAQIIRTILHYIRIFFFGGTAPKIDVVEVLFAPQVFFSGPKR